MEVATRTVIEEVVSPVVNGELAGAGHKTDNIPKTLLSKVQ